MAMERTPGFLFQVIKQMLLLLLLLLLLFPFLLTSSALHRTPTHPSHTQTHMEISEPLRIQLWWHSDSYSI